MEIEGRYVPPALLNIPLRSTSRLPMKIIKENVKEGSQVLDHGSGPGYYTFKMARLVGPTGIVYAVEPNDKALDIIRKKIEREQISNVVPLKESGSFMPSIKDESIDFVLSNLTLCCLPDHEGSIEEIMRVLKPNGKAYISINAMGTKNDNYHVDPYEWARLTAEFKILRSGRSIITRWILVAKN